MVIGLLAITAIPTVTGVGNAISAQKKQNEAAGKEQVKFNMTFIMRYNGKIQEVGTGVLLNTRIYLNLPDYPVEGHKFCGYFFKYPGEEGHRGMVSTICIEPPMLNWIYVDKGTHAVHYGARKDTLGNIIGPWGWTDDDRFLTLEGDHDAFVAVKEQGPTGTTWGLYWDPEGDIEDEAEDEESVEPVRLRRRELLGIDSKYVRDSER